MSGPEADVERWVEREARDGYGVQSVKWGVDGWPDRIFFIPGGRPFLIEFKAPGEKPRPRQEYRIGYLKSQGYDVEVYDQRLPALEAVIRRVRAALGVQDATEAVRPARVQQKSD